MRKKATNNKSIFFPIERLFHQVKYKGETVRCNLCGNNYKNFKYLAHSSNNQEMCPYCASLESTRILWFYLANEVLGKKNKNKFLYFEPEKAILKNLKRHDIDLDLQNLRYLNSLAKMEHDHKVKGGQYDVVILPHVVQYVYNDVVALEDVKRVLRPGGFVLIMTIVHPNMDRTYENINSDDDKERLSKYYEDGVKRIYGANINKHLAKAGFEVEIIDYVDQLGKSARDYYRLGNGAREIIFKCIKPSNN